MKVISYLIKISLIFTWLLTSSSVVRSQSGNMSDITGPNPGEMIDTPETPDTPVVDNPETSEAPVTEAPENPVAETPETPEAPVADNPETPAVDNPDTPEAPVAETPETPEAPVADNPETPVVENPETPVADNSETPVTETPETPVADNPETPESPVVDNQNPETPATPVTETPETPVADDPETPVTETPETPETPVAETPESPVVDNQNPATPETPIANSPETSETPEALENPVADSSEILVIETPETPETPVADTPNPEAPASTETPEAPVVDSPNPEAPIADNPETPITETPEAPVVDNQNPVADNLEVPEVPVVDNQNPETPETPVANSSETSESDNSGIPIDGGTQVVDNPELLEPVGSITEALDVPAETLATPETTTSVSLDSSNEVTEIPVDSRAEIIDVPSNTEVTSEQPGSETTQVEIELVEDVAANDGTIITSDLESETAPVEVVEDSIVNEEIEEIIVDDLENETAPVAEETTSSEETIASDLESETTQAKTTEEASANEETTVSDLESETTQAETTEEASANEEITASDTMANDPDSEAIQANTTEETNNAETNSEENQSSVTQEPEEETRAQNDAETDTELVEEEVIEENAAREEKKAEAEEDSPTEEQESQKSSFEQEVDRVAYEVQVQQASADVAIQLNEEFQTTQLIDHSGMQIYGQAPSVQAISRRLGQLWQQTGKKTAFINISLQSRQLEAFTVLPMVVSAKGEDALVASSKLTKLESRKIVLRNTVKNTSRKELLATAKEFRDRVSNMGDLRRNSYLEASQKLYQTLIAPLEEELAANGIDTLVFSMDSGLRLLPLAALHDGEQFLIEKYAIAMVPSFGLTDTRYVDPSNSQILAMGASQFAEQAPLPTMPIELQHVVNNPRQGEVYLNEEFTISNFKAQNRRRESFSIIHLGTHADFKSGDLNESYIQFYDRKLAMSELGKISDELGWNSTEKTPIELLVLSACETALGDEDAELGFAGLAVQAGVKSALASLWYVSDLGTLALMSEFYDQLSDTLLKAEALRQTQLQMLKGEVRIDRGTLKLSNGEALGLPGSFPQGDLSMSHPYFWSSFTLIGNWN